MLTSSVPVSTAAAPSSTQIPPPEPPLPAAFAIKLVPLGGGGEDSSEVGKHVRARGCVCKIEDGE